MADGADLFRDYATSGAFTLQLSRQQVSGLALCRGGTDYWGANLAVLERKGLVVRVGPDGRYARLTAPGIHALALTRIAGLVNGEPYELEGEVHDLTSKLDAALSLVDELTDKNWSLAARLQQAELRVAELEAERDGGGFQKPMITLKDKHPGLQTADLVAAREEHTNG